MENSWLAADYCVCAKEEDISKQNNNATIPVLLFIPLLIYFFDVAEYIFQ